MMPSSASVAPSGTQACASASSVGCPLEEEIELESTLLAVLLLLLLVNRARRWGAWRQWLDNDVDDEAVVARRSKTLLLVLTLMLSSWSRSAESCLSRARETKAGRPPERSSMIALRGASASVGKNCESLVSLDQKETDEGVSDFAAPGQKMFTLSFRLVGKNALPFYFE